MLHRQEECVTTGTPAPTWLCTDWPYALDRKRCTLQGVSALTGGCGTQGRLEPFPQPPDPRICTSLPHNPCSNCTVMFKVLQQVETAKSENTVY